jgi:hypothetical protein
MTQKVYVIREGVTDYYKIGRTISSVELRKTSLQTGNKIRLHITKVFECENSKDLEKSLHDYFKNKHILGEWFELCNDDINMLDDIVISLKTPIIKINKIIKTKKYNCECCEYETPRRADYFKHLESIKHKQNLTDLNKKLFTCDDCGKALTSKRVLTRHQTLYCDINKLNFEPTQNKDIEILEIKHQYELKLKEALFDFKLKEALTESKLKEAQLQCEAKIKEVVIDSKDKLIDELKTDKAKLDYNCRKYG